MLVYNELLTVAALHFVLMIAGIADSAVTIRKDRSSQEAYHTEVNGDHPQEIESNIEKREDLFKSPPTLDFIEEGKPLAKEDFERAANLKEIDVDFPRPDPIEQSGYLEGDILEDLTGRNAIQNTRSLWQGAKIPYIISKDYDERGRSIIARAMQEYHNRTCIRFVPRTTENDYIAISPDSGCASYIGRIGGPQVLSLGPGCQLIGIAIHELMHATGFMHEQSREDRDNYITIAWDNVKKGREINFKKHSWREIQSLGESYDYGSVLHYDQFAFAEDNSKPTIIPKTKGVKIGQRIGFSEVDVRKINKLYKCGESSKEGSGECKDNNNLCGVLVRNGMCQRDPVGMQEKCKKSCNFC